MAVVSMALTHSCNKPSDGHYTPVNEAIVTGMDSIYTVYSDSVLRIKPNITYSQDPIGDTANYTYEWIWLNNVGYSPTNSKVIFTGPSINMVISWDKGAYEMSLRITDRRSKLFTEKFFTLLVTNEIYEGYLLLCKEGEKSRLDMLSYKETENQFVYLKDVLENQHSGLLLKGLPNFVEYGVTQIGGGQKGGIFIGTTKGVWLLRKDDLNDITNLKYILNGTSTLPDMRLYPLGYWDLFYAGGKVISGDQQFSDITNIQQADGSLLPFTASPFLAVNFFIAQNPTVLFNTASGEFLWHVLGLNYCSSFGKGNLFNYKTGKDLLYLAYSLYSNGQYVAVLKDHSNDSVYIARFNRFTQLSYQQVASTVIAHATHFAISPEYGTLFYSVNGRLYQYDDEKGKEELMADYGPATINLLQFHNFLYGSDDVKTPSYNKARYKDMQKQILVCTFIPGNDTSGKLERFEVTPGMQPLKLIDNHIGFGEVASLTYLER
ncbi:PKD-like family protein [bacterium A37T11]|nr:PKD-like family protein [bacterium A37T11]